LREVDLAGGFGFREPPQGVVGIALACVEAGDLELRSGEGGLGDQRVLVGFDGAIGLMEALIGQREIAPGAAVAGLLRGDGFEDLGGAVEVVGLDAGQAVGEGLGEEEAEGYWEHPTVIADAAATGLSRNCAQARRPALR